MSIKTVMPGEENNTEERIYSNKSSSWNNNKKEIRRIDEEERNEGKEQERNKKKSTNFQASTAVQMRVPARGRLVSRYRRFDICLIARVQGPKNSDLKKGAPEIFIISSL
jgi:hypothetical protein